MAYATPKTWATNDLATAAQFNQDLRDNVEALHVPFLAWSSYTPTLTQSGAVTKTVTYAKYIQMGKTVFCQGILAVTGSGTGGSIVAVGLPVTSITPPSGVRPIGDGVIFDTSAGAYYRCLAAHASTTTIQFLVTSATSANYAGAADFTAALASGDAVSWNIMYEVP